MRRAYDDARLAEAYQSGNEMPETSLRAWTTLIGSFSPQPTPQVVEIGAGTGMFCAAMARYLPASFVLGVDPSAPMLAEARRFNGHDRVRYVGGSAEAVPVRAGLFDLALMSRVIHHLPDRRACAVELARVLRPGGVVVIRTTFRENLDALVYHYWPTLLPGDARRFPDQQEVTDDFTTAGFTLQQVTSFSQPVVESLRRYHARMVTKPQSKFNRLTDHEFQHGLGQLAADAAAEDPAHPTTVAERYDVAVLSTGRP